MDSTNKIDNLYILANNYLRSDHIQKATECCDKILEIDASNYNAWKMKTALAFHSYRTFSIKYKLDHEKYTNDNCNLDNDNTIPSIAKATNYVGIAFSYAKGCKEKEDLLKTLEEIIKYFLNNDMYRIFHYNKAIIMPLDNILDFVISNFTCQQALAFTEKYYQIVIDTISVNIINISKEYNKYIEDFYNRASPYMLQGFYLGEADKYGNLNSLINITFKKNNIMDINSQIVSKLTELKVMLSNKEKEMCIRAQVIKTQDTTYVDAFNAEKAKLIEMYKLEQDLPEDLKQQIDGLMTMKLKSNGCYVATCVYGSYDCPEVWTLRRFRDNTLAESWYGRMFICTYYAISPKLVKWFGCTKWFKDFWKTRLDKMVLELNKKGYEDTKYVDKF